MLFLLNKIRRKLLTDNKVTSYLFYAIGEILLVVIGILIAVSIDNWNDARVKQEEGIEYRKRLIGNLFTDNQNISKRISFFNQVYAFGKSAESHLRAGYSSNPIDQWKFVIEAYQVSQIWPIRTTITTYNELQNNGALQYLAEDSILQMVSSYYLDHSEQLSQINEGTTTYREFIRGAVPLKVQHYMWGNCFELRDLDNQQFKPCDLPIEFQTDISQVYSRIFEDPHFKDMLTRRVITLYVRNSLLADMLETNNRLLTSLKSS